MFLIPAHKRSYKKRFYSSFNSPISLRSTDIYIFDFGLLVPPGQKIRIVSRIITNPVDAKTLLMVLSENISTYEKRFGNIEVPNIRKNDRDKKHFH